MAHMSKITQLINDSDKRLLELSHQYKEKKDYVMLRLWEKFIRNAAAIQALLPGGFYEEAFAIQRLSLEHMFNFFAFTVDDNFMDEFHNHSEIQIPKTFNALKTSIAKHEEDSLTPENRSKLEESISKYEKDPVKPLGSSFFNVANKSGLASFYDSLYRELSLSHAHSTLISVLESVEEPDIERLLENLASHLEIMYLKSFEAWPEKVAEA
ncbi:TPA: DUF5677 domain-containing protein [Vibrio diabolicus]